LPSPRALCPASRLPLLPRCLKLAGLLLCLLWLTIPPHAQARSHAQKVLVVHSYHQGYLWTDEINRGIQKMFQQADPGCELFVEYLDSKRHKRAEIFPVMADLLVSKYQSIRPDVIITTDDNALDFMLAQRDRLFPGVPLVFCGLNDYTPQRLGGKKGCTGVAENFNLAGTLGLMLGLHPQAKTVYVVSDVTESGRKNLKRLQEVKHLFEDKVKFVEMAGLEASELERRLKGLPDDCVVLNLSFWRDSTGRGFEFKEGIQFVTQASPVPVYSPWDHMVRCGTVGGYVISGVRQGREAARLALMVLGGKPVDRIPVITDIPNLPMFDHAALNRFSIPAGSLPPDSVVINRPQSFYHRYKLLFWLITAFFVAQSVAIAALGVNMARRKRAELALRKSEQHYRELFDSISDLVYTQDLDGHFLSVNRAMANVFGYSSDEVVGRRASEFMRPELQEAFDTVYLKSIKDKGHHSGISLYFDNQGKKYYVEYRSALVKPPFGPAYISGSGRDVTKRIQTEKQLRLLQRQLMQSQKMEAIGNLAGGIAHDFNNILGVMLGYTELALESAEEGVTSPDELKAVLQACERGRDLVRQILAFSRQNEPNRRQVDLVELIKEALTLLRASLPRTIEIKSSLGDIPALTVADPTQVHQVLMNLCANSAHAMRDKGGVLGITLSRIDLDPVKAGEYPTIKLGAYHLLTVSDTGQGMSSDVQSRIFEPFFTTKPQGEGTGMGLAVVHGIVSTHGGAVRVWSAPGQGSRFEILLPVVEPADRYVTETQPAEGGRERILVVDDEPDLVWIVQKTLSSKGYQVKAFSDSKQALKVLMENPDEFDLVFTDQTMPGLTGAELAREALFLRPDMPIILCTGFSETIDQKQARAIGIKEFVMKPVLTDELARTVRRVLDNANDEKS
jgi:two-component system cell cycle sensor histidine kinase/response regulator CckA